MGQNDGMTDNASDGKEVKGIYKRSCARVGKGSARYRPLAVHGVGCLVAGLNLKT